MEFSSHPSWSVHYVSQPPILKSASRILLINIWTPWSGSSATSKQNFGTSIFNLNDLYDIQKSAEGLYSSLICYQLHWKIYNFSVLGTSFWAPIAFEHHLFYSGYDYGISKMLNGLNVHYHPIPSGLTSRIRLMYLLELLELYLSWNFLEFSLKKMKTENFTNSPGPNLLSPSRSSSFPSRGKLLNSPAGSIFFLKNVFHPAEEWKGITFTRNSNWKHVYIKDIDEWSYKAWVIVQIIY